MRTRSIAKSSVTEVSVAPVCLRDVPDASQARRRSDDTSDRWYGDWRCPSAPVGEAVLRVKDDASARNAAYCWRVHSRDHPLPRGSGPGAARVIEHTTPELYLSMHRCHAPPARPPRAHCARKSASVSPLNIPVRGAHACDKRTALLTRPRRRPQHFLTSRIGDTPVDANHQIFVTSRARGREKMSQQPGN